ncbi:MAG: GatB/YqeY domain-containing protein [Alphaproteobacteria bacterium]|nr:GatB/YqeY domain-containing protein [Alphaproteobacteria bacterium]
MTLRKQFQDELKLAQHAKDELKTGTLRLIMAALKDRDIAARSKENWDGVGDEEILAMLQTMIKQRQESIKMYTIGNRQDLIEREAAEIKIIENFLPTQLTEDEIKSAVEDIVKSVSASGIKDMGKVMAELKTRYTGQMDFAKASGIVKERLAG